MNFIEQGYLFAILVGYLLRGNEKNILDFFENIANLPLSRWLPIRGMLAVRRMKTICEFY